MDNINLWTVVFVDFTSVYIRIYRSALKRLLVSHWLVSNWLVEQAIFRNWEILCLLVIFCLFLLLHPGCKKFLFVGRTMSLLVCWFLLSVWFRNGEISVFVFLFISLSLHSIRIFFDSDYKMIFIVKSGGGRVDVTFLILIIHPAQTPKTRPETP